MANTKKRSNASTPCPHSCDKGTLFLNRQKRENTYCVIKRAVAFLLVCAICVLPLSSCATVSENDGVIVVTTIFASYDFSRQIVGDNGSVKMLLPPGSDSHSFEPSPKDMLAINKCDVFICVGGESDAWLDEIIAAAENPDMKIIKLMEHTEGLICSDHGHDHGHDHEHEHDHGHGHGEYDEHVWTNPRNAVLACRAITDVLCEKDSKNADEYRENLSRYQGKLYALDTEIQDIVENGKSNTLVFGDRFPLIYFTEAYGLEYVSAFPGCAAETEPSAATVASLINKVKEENIPTVFYLELSTGNIADTICESTGAKKTRFNSCHNVSKTDFENGVTYLELMQENANALREALN